MLTFSGNLDATSSEFWVTLETKEVGCLLVATEEVECAIHAPENLSPFLSQSLAKA